MPWAHFGRAYGAGTDPCENESTPWSRMKPQRGVIRQPRATPCGNPSVPEKAPMGRITIAQGTALEKPHRHREALKGRPKNGNNRHHPYPGPKGRNTPAQGNARGQPVGPDEAPTGRNTSAPGNALRQPVGPRKSPDGAHQAQGTALGKPVVTDEAPTGRNTSAQGNALGQHGGPR